MPAIEIAGVFVWTYLDDDGTLRVSLGFEEADPAVFGEDEDGYARNVPVQVTLSGQTVYSIDREGQTDPEIIRHNTEEQPAVIIRPGEPVHVFGDVNVITGPYGAAEKLAELDETDD